MIFSGFTDEVSSSLADQIAVTKELGWSNIEMRDVDDKLLGTMTDEEFDKVYQMFTESGVKLHCYGSAVANWRRHPRSAQDFEETKNELLTAIPRMQKLGCKLIRGMSFLMTPDEEPDSPELEQIIFAKVKELVKICEDNGIVYGHENCMNYGGLSYLHTLKLLEAVGDTKAFTLIYDTGNPCFNYRHIGQKPYPLQSSWEFYKMVRPYVTHVHIKDGTALPQADGNRPSARFTFAGDGNGDVRAIMTDLRETGYDGAFSMEPHMGSIYHDPNGNVNSPEAKKFRHDIYVEYCKRFMQLLRECGWQF